MDEGSTLMEQDSTAVALAELRRICSSGEARAIREAADLHLAEIARDVGIPHSTLRGWENGEQRPNGERAVRYLRLLKRLHRAAGGPAWQDSHLARRA
jgi:DNA-binding transcriptional regulator YiaG